MKNSNKTFIKFKILFVYILLFVSPIVSYSQIGSFVYLEQDRFMLKCENFYPVATACPVAIHKDINGDFHISPSRGYCPWTSNCNGTWSCGIDSLSWANETRQQIDTLAAMGFNIVRLNGLSVKFEPIPPTSGGLYSARYFAQEDPNNLFCNTEHTEGYSINENTFLRQAKLMKEFIEVVRDHNNEFPDKPLRVTILTGVGPLYLKQEQYISFVEYIAEYFNDEPLVFSYEINSEPAYFDDPMFQVNEKYDKANYFGEWYYSMKVKAPQQFITFGATTFDVLNWDAETFPVDYINFHLYPNQSYSYSGHTLERFKSSVKRFSDSYSKPWIIGETSIAGNDYVHDNWNDSIVTESEQEEYALNAVLFSKHYGASGFTWWVYKEFPWFPDNAPIRKLVENYYGLVLKGSNIEEYKSAAKNVFQVYDPWMPCDTCSNPNNTIYYNYFGYDDVAAYGSVTDGNGDGLKNAYISARAEKYVNNVKISRIYSTFSDESGNYELTREADFKIWKIDVTYPGMSVNTVWPNPPIFPGVSENIDFQLEPLDPDLLPGPIIFNDNLTIEAGQTITWDNVKAPNETYIAIEPGATLIIKDTVYVKPNTKIVVKQGGKLELDNGAIIGLCTWQGIEVWGTATASQNPTDQGRVQVINGGTIENAIVGVQTIKFSIPDGSGGGLAPDYAYTGGMVMCDGAIFKNNRIAVKFWPYSYASSNSLFRDCQFITNNDMIEITNPDKFIEMTDISGIKISGSSFSDERTNANYNELTTGIKANNTRFSVWQSSLQASIFSGLQYAIYATASSPTKYIDVSHSDFTNNFRGIFISGMTNAEVVENNFSINSAFSQYNGGYGLYLDRSTAYKIEENNFYHDNGNQLGVGLIVNQSGVEPNMIYRNYFTNLECGMDIQGENKASDGTGLELKCNQYEGTRMDKIITWDVPKITKLAGIATNQGASSSNPEDMAGNLFQIDGQTPNGDYDDILNEGNHITYYYPLNFEAGFENVKPVDYTKNTVDLKGVPFSPNNPWTFENGCPPNENGGGGGGTGTADGLKSSIAQSGQRIDSVQNLLSLLIDGGNTMAVQTGVETSVPPETMQVYTNLMNKSPYLSDTVVSTAIVKENVLPAAMIRDIMVANPKTAKSEVLMKKLNERWNPLPDYMKGQILQGRSIVSVREETESRLAAFVLERAGHFNALVQYYLNDTISPQASPDSLTALLQSENSLNAKYMLAFLQGEQGGWTQALSTLNSIPGTIELTPAQQTVHQQLTDYFNLLSGLAAENKSILQADSTQIATLKTIEQANAGIASVYARNILLALNESNYEEPIILPDMLKAAAISEDYQTLIDKANRVTGMITIRPNPAKDYVIVGYDFETETAAVIEITGTDGKTAYSKKANGLKDQFTVDTRQWKPGLYVATVKINGKITESVKFTVIQ